MVLRVGFSGIAINKSLVRQTFCLYMNSEPIIIIDVSRPLYKFPSISNVNTTDPIYRRMDLQVSIQINDFHKVQKWPIAFHVLRCTIPQQTPKYTIPKPSQNGTSPEPHFPKSHLQLHASIIPRAHPKINDTTKCRRTNSRTSTSLTTTRNRIPSESAQKSGKSANAAITPRICLLKGVPFYSTFQIFLHNCASGPRHKFNAGPYIFTTRRRRRRYTHQFVVSCSSAPKNFCAPAFAAAARETRYKFVAAGKQHGRAGARGKIFQQRQQRVFYGHSLKSRPYILSLPFVCAHVCMCLFIFAALGREANPFRDSATFPLGLSLLHTSTGAVTLTSLEEEEVRPCVRLTYVGCFLRDNFLPAGLSANAYISRYLSNVVAWVHQDAKTAAAVEIVRYSESCSFCC